MKMKKLVALEIILLFIGVAVAPTINFSVVKASTDNDLVEVTSQACGIQGFGNTTVKLTKQQYQNLEQYLVDFRARLNQTTTREEAVPIFKDAVVELNKYGLLPKGMSIEQAQRLVIGREKEKNRVIFNQRLQNIISKNDLTNYNYACLVAGVFTDGPTQLVGPILSIVLMIFDLLRINDGSIALGILMIVLINPIDVLSTLYVGSHIDTNPTPANGSIWSNGLLGVKKWNGELMGAMKHPYFRFDNFPFGDSVFHPGAIGFTGIDLFDSSMKFYYFGSALILGISYN